MSTKLTQDQIDIYKTLFDKHSRNGKDYLNKHKTFTASSERVFGCNVFDCFLIPQTDDPKNLHYYLSNIILYTKFITGLAEFANGNLDAKNSTVDFKVFHANVAQFCIDIVKHFYKESFAVFSPEFETHLKDTVMLSLESPDIQRVLDIFKLKIKIITLNLILSSAEMKATAFKPGYFDYHRSSPNLLPTPRSFSELVERQRTRLRKSSKERSDVQNSLFDRGAKMLTAADQKAYAATQIQHICYALRDSTANSLSEKKVREKLTSLRNKYTTEVSDMAFFTFILPNDLKPAAFLSFLILGFLAYIGSPYAFHAVLLFSATSLAAFYLDTRYLKAKYQKRDEARAQVQKGTLIKQFVFKPLPAFSGHFPIIEDQHDSALSIDSSHHIEKPKSKPLRVKPKAQVNQNLQRPEIPRFKSALPPHFYATSSPGQLVFFNPREVTVIDPGRGNSKINAFRFSEKGYTVHKLSDENYPKKLKDHFPHFDYKLKIRRENARCYGKEVVISIGEQEKTVCIVTHLHMKAH